MNTLRNLFQHDRCRFRFALRTWANPFQGSPSSARSATVRHRSCHSHASRCSLFASVSGLHHLVGGTDKCAPSRGVDEKMCHVPAQVNSPLKIRPDGFIRPSAPRGKAGGGLLYGIGRAIEKVAATFFHAAPKKVAATFLGHLFC